MRERATAGFEPRAFQSGQAWIMWGQTSRVAATSAAPAAAAKRTASSSNVCAGSADLNESRRKSVEIGEERRKARVFPGPFPPAR